jgi:hypothetical protein
MLCCAHTGLLAQEDQFELLEWVGVGTDGLCHDGQRLGLIVSTAGCAIASCDSRIVGDVGIDRPRALR